MAKCSYCGRESSETTILHAGDKSFCNDACRSSFEKNGGTIAKKSKKTSTAVGAITAAVVAVVVGQLTTGFLHRDFAGLKEFNAPDKSFTVMLPKDVQNQKQTVNTQLGPIEVYLFSAKAKHQEFTVVYSDYPDSYIAATDPKAILDGSRDGAVRNIQGQLLGETLIEMKGHPGRELKIEGPQKMIIKTRIYLVKNRLYQVMAVSNPDHAYDKKITEVFESFKVNGI